MLLGIRDYAPRIKREIILPSVKWDGTARAVEARRLACALTSPNGD